MKILSKSILSLLLSVLLFSCSKDEYVEPVGGDTINISMNVFARDTAVIGYNNQEIEVIKMKQIKGTIKVGETFSIRIDNINVTDRTLVSIYMNNVNVEQVFLYPSTSSFLFTKDITAEYLKNRQVKY